MTEPKGHMCPECGAPRAADNTPSCGCTERASEALRDAREAQAAAAEDFDPLRIRPYVELDGATQEVPVAAAEATMPLRAITGSAPPEPSTQDLRLFEPGEGSHGRAGNDEPGGGPRIRRRRTVLLGAGGALVAVVAAAGLASGLFSYETPARDTALPDDVRASVPDTSPSEPSASPSGNRASAPPPPVSHTPSATASASASPSQSASPSPSTSPTPTQPPPTVTATGTVTATDNDRQTAPPVLRRGDSGDEVRELELRLTQLGLYTRKASGHYNEGVEDAVTRYQQARGIQVEEYGVYDLETRAHLESETTEP
ncbi:peptidoglycan-binding domain-containing protein [Streptomyces cylindrosporus]|uniref:Peptidoglycan-binding protein n=1 Tax=Streptomyces cylindrosporus TaxID=2927583 RepID=A0ABS9XYJ1_9ACTN|nr:peptidoglycan-binding domain-containing protein [Streptomyces cylindrosporus]MCI3270022.1 peptidoglycan-binding protein [Streptomyces cylindrosporus]